MTEVEITLRSKISADNDEEQNVFVYKGGYSRKGELHRIVYREGTEKTALYASARRVAIERTGDIKSKIAVAQGEKTLTAYKIPEGEISLEISGVRVENELPKRLFFEYFIGSRGEFLSRNEIEITLKEV